MAKTLLSSEGLKNSLKKYDISESVMEYVWNGFDAQATKIEINEEKNELGNTQYLTITDNGVGIDRKLLDNKFTYVYESEKKILSDADINTKGKKGVGRYSFYNVANNAQWETIYNDNGLNKKYKILIKSDALIDYIPSDEETTIELTRTKVTLNLNTNININKIIEDLKIVYAWYLELYKNKEIYVNGNKLDCSDMLYDEKVKEFIIEDKFNCSITVCVWRKKLNDEYSKYYFIGKDNEVKHKENTTLNNKGDNFYHSVFIKSDLFDEKFSFKSMLGDDNIADTKTKQCKEYKELKKECDEFLTEIRKPFIRQYAKIFIEKLKSKKVYPNYDEKNPIDVFKSQQLDDLIANVYYFVPKVFTSLNIIQQKTLVRMFELIQETGESKNLFRILDDVVDLTTEERQDMAELLDTATLSNIISMQKLVVDRLQAIKDFETLIYDTNRYVNEVDHIQKFIENHYWFFGEEYHLATAEEPNFEEALRRFLNYASDCYYKKGEITIDNQNKNKQMDIFAIQQIPNGDIKKCIVVELKRPSVTLSMDELNQIKTYYNVIKKEDRFNAKNIEWEFYLIGNDYDQEINGEIINAKAHGIKSLVYYVDNCKIFVKKWSEVLTQLKLNFNYLNDKLKINYDKLKDNSELTSNEIVLMQEMNEAKRPTSMTN